jgi:hypothetical protein
MATEVLIKDGTPIVFADTTDYSSTNSGFTRTAQIDLTSIANSAARQSDKVDLGATRAVSYAVHVGIEMDVAPTAGNLVEFYWSPSISGTAGTGNTGGASGADGAYKAGEVDEWKRQLMLIGALVLTNDAATTVQVGCVNSAFFPPTRYGSLVVVNKSGQAFEGDAVEMYVALVPNVDEIQNA